GRSEAMAALYTNRFESDTTPVWNAFAAPTSTSYQSTWLPAPPATVCEVHTARWPLVLIRGSGALTACVRRASSVSIVYAGMGGLTFCGAGGGGSNIGTDTHFAAPLVGTSAVERGL